MLGGSDSNSAAKARFREAVPAQPVDATPSNQLIRQYFSRAPISKAVLNQNLNRAVFSFNQRSRMNLAFETPADTSSAECCVDPLRPPRFSGLEDLPVSELAVLSSIRLSESDCGVSLTLGQHNKPRSITAFKVAVIRVVAILIGILLSLVAYYNPFGEGWGGNRLEAQCALF